MSTILIAGNTGFFTKESLEALSREHDIILAGRREDFVEEQNANIYHVYPMEEKIGWLFDKFSIQAVWYVSGFVDGGAASSDDEWWIQKIMSECKWSKVGKLIFLSTVESRNCLTKYGTVGEAAYKEFSSYRARHAAQAEDLCSYYAEKYGVTMITLWLPYIIYRVNDSNFLGKIFWDIYNKNKFLLTYGTEDRIDFITLKELTGLLLQISKETGDGSGRYFVLGGYRYTYGDFVEMLKTVSEDVQVVYESFADLIRIPQFQQELQYKYGFEPLENVVENIAYYYRIFLKEVVHDEVAFRCSSIRSPE